MEDAATKAKSLACSLLPLAVGRNVAATIFMAVILNAAGSRCVAHLFREDAWLNGFRGLILAAFKWLTGVAGVWFLLPAIGVGAPGFGLGLRAREMYNLCVCLIYSI
jgi:hypothetical protein